MHRSRFIGKSLSLSLLVLTAIFAVSAACEVVSPDPCQPSFANGSMDGIWRVITINDQPAMNWPLPTSSDRFHSGIIEFETINTTGGDCTDVDESNGYATAIYATRKADGSLVSDRYVGTFELIHRRHGFSVYTIEIAAAGYTVNGSVDHPTLTLPASHARFGNATFVLQRVP